MSYRFLQSVYIWLIRVGLFVIPFLSLFVSSSMLFPYITGRNFSFRLIIEAVFLLWVGLAVLNKEYLPKPSKLLWAVFGFVFIVGFADVLGANPYRSFFSNYERMEGFLMISHMALFFLVLTSVFKSKKEWYWWFSTVIVASIFVSFNALLQKLGVYQSLQGGTRVDGTIGNPTYLAAYLMFSFFLSLFLFSEFRKSLFRYAYLAVALFELVIIYFTATRGASLALLGGGFLFIVLYLIFVKAESGRERLFKKAAALGIAVLILVPLALYLLRDSNFVSRSNTLGRLTHISLNDKTTRSRFMIWGMAWKAVKERPILGYGQENFGIIFSKFYNPQLFDQEPWFDRSHDIIFDWLVNAGIIGLLSYLSLFIMSFVLLWQGARYGVVLPKESIILFVALISYFAQNIFVFDNFNTYYVFFGIMAYINTYSYSFPPPPGADAPPAQKANSALNQQKFQPQDKRKSFNTSILAVPKSLSAVCALGIFILIFAYFLSIKPLKQSRALINALRSGAEAKSALDVLNSFKYALSYRSFGDSEVREQLAQFALQTFNNTNIPQEQRNEIARFAVEELEKQVRLIPGDVKYKLFLANLFMVFSSADPTYSQKTELTLLEALKQSPTKQPVYFTLAQYYFNTNQAEKALEISWKAAELAPNYVDAQVNLAMVAIYLGKKDIEERVTVWIEKMFETANDGHNQYPKLINAYSAVNNYSKVVEYYGKLIDVRKKINQPDNAQDRINFAISLAKIGQIDLAKEQVKEAVRLDPDKYGKEEEEIIKYLESGQDLP